MAITKMICQQCSAPIEWDGVSRRLQCSFCGTIYERTSRQNGQISNQRYIDERGNEFLVGYYPPMFHGAYQIRNEGNKMNLNCREMPVKVYYEMTSEDGNAHILFITGSVYHHIDNIPANSNKQNTISADLRRYRSYIGADAYADLRFSEEHPKATNVRVIKVEEPCAKSKESLEKLKVQNQSRLVGKYNNEFAGKIYSYSENGLNQLCLTRLALEILEVPTMSDMIGNMFGGKKFSGSGGMLSGLFGNMGETVQKFMPPSVSKNITWTVFNEIYFFGSEEGFNTHFDEFEKVYETIKTGPDFSRIVNEINRMFMQTEQTIANNAMRMANAQMESAQRMGNMINDTYSYGMELDRQSWANTNATMDRVNDMRSEAIRGVNSYTTGSGDFVEADVRFDSVYQNTQNPDLYAGVEGNYDMGSEWTVLKKRF